VFYFISFKIEAQNKSGLSTRRVRMLHFCQLHLQIFKMCFKYLIMFFINKAQLTK